MHAGGGLALASFCSGTTLLLAVACAGRDAAAAAVLGTTVMFSSSSDEQELLELEEASSAVPQSTVSTCAGAIFGSVMESFTVHQRTNELSQ